MMMKNVKLILIASILLCLSCEKVMAQSPYKMSIGGTLGVIATGASFKTFLTEDVSLQSDILYKVTFLGMKFGFYPAIEVNTNVMYQKKLKDKQNSELFWFIGGGISLGNEIMYAFNGKFGANAITGLEFVFKDKPLAFQMDLRPGYGMLFNSGNELKGNAFHPNYNPWPHFDWMIGFTLRYTFKEK